MRRVARAVPVGVEPIAHELLVKARLALAGLVLVLWPEARRVRRDDLVGQGELAVDQAKLEFRIGDDDAALGRVVGGRLIDLEHIIIREGFCQVFLLVGRS